MAKHETPVAAVISAQSAMIAKLASLKPHPIPTFPEPEDFMERAAHMREVALAVDAYILALGQDAKENVRGSFDLSLFTSPLSDAINGNATYELESYAEELEDEMADEGVS